MGSYQQPERPPPQQQHQPQQPQQHGQQEQQQQHGQPKQRAVCSGCGRPLRVCLCPALPPTQLVLNGHVVVLQHPHETKKPLATVPLLRKIVAGRSCTCVVGRRVELGRWPEFDELLVTAAAHRVPLLLLFPGPGAANLRQLAPSIQQRHAARSSSAGTQQRPPPAYLLLVADGTWRQAREMTDALTAWLDAAPSTHAALQGLTHQLVQLPPLDALDDSLEEQQDEEQQEEEAEGGAGRAQQASVTCGSSCAAGASARLRLEPAEGLCTTLQAVGAAVGALEGRPQVYDACLAPLRLMAEQQAAFDPALAARLAGGRQFANGRKAFGMAGRLQLASQRRRPPSQSPPRAAGSAAVSSVVGLML